MTREEFRAWLNHHARLYPEVHSYLTTVADAAEVKETWYRLLGGIDHEVAQQASVEMLGGTPPAPSAVSKHPSAIATHARRITGVDRRRDPIVAYNMRYTTAFKFMIRHGVPLDQIWSTIDDAADPIESALEYLRANAQPREMSHG